MTGSFKIFALACTLLLSMTTISSASEPSESLHFKKISKSGTQPAAHAEDTAADESNGLPKDAPVAVKKAVVNSHAAPGTSSSPAAHSAHGGHEGVAPDRALQFLTNGNTRYLTRRLRADGRGAGDRKRLLAGQHPHTIVLSCADSRVPPETVFDQALGEIFTVRVAGEALDSSVIASVEYAVDHLGPQLLVVMGHTQCGAVDAALKVKEGDSAGSEALDKLLSDIRPRLKSIAPDKISPALKVESEMNAEGVAKDILNRSPMLRKKVAAGELVIKSALYHMDSGKVFFH